MKKQLRLAFVAMLLFAATVLTPFITVASAQPNNPSLPRIVDNSDLLTDQEEDFLLSRISEIHAKYAFDVVFVTENDLQGKSTRDFADDFFDYGGYGVGDDNSGVLVLISDEGRWISGTGRGIMVFSSDYGIPRIGKMIAPYFDDGEYFDGFNSFLNFSDEFLKQEQTGDPYTEGNPYRTLTDKLKTVGIIAVAAFILSLLIVSGMKRSMKTARLRSEAGEYVVQGSFVLTRESDTFLYSTVTRTAIPKSDSSSSSGGGGSSSHRGSSGTSHSGGSF
ncbi:MAG: TPM domain-containing protein [Ruminococcaceae bacterium]|nr:TPM domain-containing protein [Oscillospiraceae bacterium]